MNTYGSKNIGKMRGHEISVATHEDENLLIDFFNANNLSVIEFIPNGYHTEYDFIYALWDNELNMYYRNYCKEGNKISSNAIKRDIKSLFELLEEDFFENCVQPEKVSKFRKLMPLYAIVRHPIKCSDKSNNIIGIYPTLELAEEVFVARAKAKQSSMGDLTHSYCNVAITNANEAHEFWGNAVHEEVDEFDVFYETIEKHEMKI